MNTKITWTGEKAKLLQEALDLSVRKFAGHLGVDPRTVVKWRKNGEGLTCNSEMQEVLGRTLDLASEAQRAAFYASLPDHTEPSSVPIGSASGPQPCTVVSHKFLPTYVGAELAVLFGKATSHPEGPGGLERRVLALDHPTATRSTLHVLACGVAVAHLEEVLSPSTLTDLALWRYQTYPSDRAWVGERLRALLASGQSNAPAEDPQYALSVYELRDHSWTSEAALTTALHLLTTPSVLVNRQDPDDIRPIGPHVEAQKFRTSWVHPGALPFHGGVSPGLAGWSGVAYHPLAEEHALTIQEIVALEVDVQALWALSSRVLQSVEEGEDPVMPDEYGWRYLRGAYSRLRAARPTETAQHRAMREAILATSELPDRLRDAQDALRDSHV